MSAVRLGSNISSLIAQRLLNAGSSELSRNYERLSSGLRINRAADDAAGLSISQSLNSDRRVFLQGIRNFNDGISLLAIADSALANLSDIAVRLKELAEQAANGTYGSKQREALDNEAQVLAQEYLRISQTTSFNGISLFNGSVDSVRLQGGYGLDGSIAAGVGGAIGTGTFVDGQSYLSPDADEERYYAALAADFNGDGIIDLASAGSEPSANGGYISVQFGYGDGTFASSKTYQLNGGEFVSYGLGANDLNGDGVLDLVTVGTNGTGLATIFIGNSDGTFKTGPAYAMTSSHSQDVELEDLNGDGIPDLIAAGNGGGAGRVAIRFGRGDGTFGAVTSYSMDLGSTRALDIKDLNGDGILDLVSAGQSGGGSTTIRLGNRDGSFRAPFSYAMETTASYDVALNDINGDGHFDIVTSGLGGGQGWATVRPGAGDGTFGAATSYQMHTSVSESVKLSDLNGDGFLDLISSGDRAGAVGEFSVRLGNGDGTFAAYTSYMTGVTAHDVAIGDFNRDGVPDITAVGGENSGPATAVTFLANTVDGVSPLLEFNLRTMAWARQALPLFSEKIQQLAMQRGEIGAYQSRIAVGMANLQTASENYAAAESRIKDADIAEESSNLVRLNILQQTGAAVLAQANLQPELALRLLSP
ncbi:MAG: VCBS repeat-containing protein [Deltaproteobacteria bacterium]|nr:VCBS repeat-containing protein [Deltaproteobacteria bacterium]